MADQRPVVAVPLGVLKTRALTFTPSLPADRAEVIARLGFGRYEKVVLRFARTFWREAGWSNPAGSSIAGPSPG